MGLFPQKKPYELKHDGPFILVANHGSDLDIPLAFTTAPKPVVFVGKAELAKMPVFGSVLYTSAIEFSSRDKVCVRASHSTR